MISFLLSAIIGAAAIAAVFIMAAVGSWEIRESAKERDDEEDAG